MATTRVLMAVLLALLALAGTPAQQQGDAKPPERPRIGLVLSGGGARGAAHVGVLQVMEELRIPVDSVVGTSMGSIIGGLYAAGYSPDEMSAALAGIDWKDAFNDSPPRKNIPFRRKEDDRRALFDFEIGVGRDGFSWPAGLIAGQKLNFILRSMTLGVRDVDDFDELRIPYRAVAADLETGDMVVLGEGDLATAMRASMSIPGAFTPVELDGRLLVDGGIARNLPIDVGHAMGADVIIAVDVGTPPGQLGEEQSILSVASRTISVMAKRNVREQLELLREDDTLIVPDLSMVRTADFDKVATAVEQGDAAARLHEDELRRYSVSESEFEEFLNRQRKSEQREKILISDVEVVGLNKIDPRIVTRRIHSRPGQELTIEDVRSDLTNVSRIGEFEQVDFSLPKAGDETRLVIDVTEKSWGPGYLRFGLDLDSDLNGNGEFSLLANYRRHVINRFGAEWQTIFEVGDVDGIFSEFFQPMGFSGFWFVAPRIGIRRDEGSFFLETGEQALLDAKQRLVGMDLGVQFRGYGEIRLGAERGRIEADELSGTLGRSFEYDTGGWRLRATVDQLDNAFFPRHGTYFLVDLFLSRDQLEAGIEYERAILGLSQVWSIGNNTLFSRLGVGTDFDSDIPFYDQFRLGGFFRLSGLKQDSLQGNVFGLAEMTYYWKLTELESILGGAIYLGASLETGNAWADVDAASFSDLLLSGSVWVGVETILGPTYIAYGLAEGGQDSFYLRLGRIFE